MPRKVSKSEKPALLFLERPVCGAKLQNVPEVRAALNPKDFFPETQTQNNSSVNSWVNPQFNCTVPPAPPMRKGRRCQSATSILDSCSQLSRKNSVCKFPSLSFQTGSKDQCQKPKSGRTKRGAECTVVSDVRNQPWGSRQNERTLSRQCADATKRQLAKNRKRNTETFSAATNRCLEIPEIPSIDVTERCRIPADGASAFTFRKFGTTEVCSVDPPPDVDTSKISHEGSSCPSSPVHLLLAQPCTPPCNQPPDTLVADTPERDYGVKVTWRRRRGLMLMLKERGHLSESATLIQRIANL
ncbi:RAD9, HUS1, RAD1-interacting nuclear orphan protein 1 [Melanotaenia boesemani]|uniref:RAD9, HUS1, RAD1-interacting nuclear orphan protein 1 n=1 Tax=Melanotaenia boesemani TaxID=1250792 RepID=UPI001C03C187|nr:RAD9, HUS1, RAD1-interacting nuclear orphan protein 1 [Melanotaenia boesemani]XP_041833534.1 RAD9, HUS1, RAD1-interacting nuclear orphan protein 1 [Melanotaenia boesemani]